MATVEKEKEQNINFAILKQQKNATRKEVVQRTTPSGQLKGLISLQPKNSAPHDLRIVVTFGCGTDRHWYCMELVVR